MNWKILIVIILVIIIIIGVFLFKKGGLSISELISKPEDIDNVIDANNQFALDFYSELKDKEESNIFFSPYSISTALAMVYEGAERKTADEIQSVFHFPENDDLRRTAYAEIFDEINKKEKKYKLHTANALWAQEDYQFSDEYFKIIEEYYKGKIANLDFKKNPEGSRVTINNWVENQTNNKIKDLIPPGVLNVITKLVLTNAIYFKGEWVKQFNENDTKEGDFRINKNNSVKASMMQRTDNEAIFNYTENNRIQVLEMPYSGGELSMLILLPKNDDLERLENSLSIKKLSGWKKDLKEQRVKIFIPKFKFESKYFMAENLKAMGMPTAFSDLADFSGMERKEEKEEKEGLKIDKVVHQTFIEVNEEGTEATAATGVMMAPIGIGGIKEPKIPIFRADHPFIFLIQDRETGNVLFMGRVTNPVI
jgi:serpin B